MKTIRRPISILLAILMVVGMFTMVPITASAAPPESGSSGSMETGTTVTPSAATWTFKLNSNFSGGWNADTDVVSEQPIELNLAEGDYEFQIVAYEDGNLSAYRGNAQAGSFTENYSQIMSDNGGNAKFHANGGKYTLTYNAGTGVATIAPVYVAQIDETNYKTLEAAFAAAADGDTITLLADCAGNGIKVPQGKFANGLTVDFANHTYTVDGETVGSTGTETNGFQLLKNNKITFQNGTIYSEKAKILVQNYSNLGLYDMTLTLKNPDYTSAYTLSNNNGNAGIHNTTINANPAGGFAFDVCRYSSYPSVYVEVTGEKSVINGNVEISASNGDPQFGFSLTLGEGTMNGDIVVDPSAQTAIEDYPTKAVVTKANTFTQTAPEGFKWVDNGQGGSTLVALPYAAKIGNNKYRTLEEAFAAAQDGDTITLLDDCTGNGIVVPQGKFNNKGLIVDFYDNTYTVDGETVGSTGTETNGFQLLKDNKITFKNGIITSAKAKILVQNYSDLTLLGMILTLDNPNYTSAYTLSNNNGDVVIDSTTINANPKGGFAFDVCRFSSYPFVHVTVKGGSDIQGDVEISASKGNAKEGFSLTLEGGSMTGNIVVDASAQALVGEKNKVTKADTFTKDAPEGFKWVDNGDNTASLAPDYVAEVNGTGYMTFAEAAAAANGEVITLLKNAPAYTMTAGETLKVKKNGFKFSTPNVEGAYVVNYATADGVTTYTTAEADIEFTSPSGAVSYKAFSSTAISSSGTYKLLKDVSATARIAPGILASNITLDLNGHTLTSTASDYGILLSRGGSAASPKTFDLVDTSAEKGGKLVATSADQAIAVAGKYNNVTIGEGVTVEGCVALTSENQTLTVNGTINGGNDFAIATNGSATKNATITVNDGAKVTSNVTAIYLPGTGTTTINGGEVTGATAIYQKSGTLNVNGGTITGNGAAAEFTHNGNGANATGDAIVIESCNYPGGTPTTTINGGTFVSENGKQVGDYTYGEAADPEVTATTKTLTLPEDLKWVETETPGVYEVAPKDYVAKVGETKYETLDEAIEAAQTGDTITLLDDIALTGANWFVVDNKDLTIDLGGKNISSEDSVFVLKNGADLTVKNGTMTTSVSGDYAIYVNNGSVFTLNNDATLKATNSNGNGIIVRDGGKAVINGTIESGYYSIAGFGSAVVDVNAGASITSTDASALSGNGSDGNEGYTFNINGGTLTSVNDVAIYHPNQGALNITGGTITGATAIYVKSGTTDISTSTTSISGATITGNGAAKEFVHSGNGCNPTGDAIVIENCGYPGGTPAIDISGGTIVSENADPVHSYGYNDYEPIEKFISGGTFNKAVPANYAANGYIPVDNGDGTYGVEAHTPHSYDNWAFNWTQDAATGDWTCNKLTLTCICGDTQKYDVTGFFGTSAVTCTANDDGSFTYTVKTTVEGRVYTDTQELEANNVIKSVTQLKAAAKKGGEWELGADIDGAVDVQCANGFVLDGNNHIVTRHANVSTQAVFRTTTNPAEITLKNLTIDGIAGKADLKPAIATKQSNPSAGNVINLENVDIINYDFDADNNGTILAWGQATVNMTDCTVATDSQNDVWAGAAAKVNIIGGEYGNVYLNSGSNGGAALTVDDGADVANITLGGAKATATINDGNVDAITADFEIPKEAVVMDPNFASAAAPAGYKWVDSATAGKKTLDKADLFAGYGLTLRGDIGLIFYLDPAAMNIDIDNVNTVSVSFTCDKYTGTVDNFTKEGDYIKVAYNVPAAYMASPVHAYSVTINGNTSNEIDEYSVQQYALRIIADPEGCNIPEAKANAAVKLMKEMLNYGAKAKDVFQTQMQAPQAAVYAPIPNYTMADVSATDIETAIKAANNDQTGDDMSKVVPQAGAKFYTPSLIFLSESTLRLIFEDPNGANVQGYTGSQQNHFYWVDKVNIEAANLDTLYTFKVNGVSFKYSALDYAKAVLESGNTSAAAKELVSAMYLYNQAANAYYTV